jgi:predicted PurR-regulated permease PerM
MLAAFIAIFSLVLIIAGGITLFSSQIIQLSSDVSNFSEKVMAVFTDAILFFNRNVSFMENLNREELLEKVQEWLKNSVGSLVRNTFSNTASFFTGLITTIIFVYPRQACVTPEFSWAYIHDEAIIMNGGPYESNTFHVS